MLEDWHYIKESFIKSLFSIKKCFIKSLEILEFCLHVSVEMVKPIKYKRSLKMNLAGSWRSRSYHPELVYNTVSNLFAKKNIVSNLTATGACTASRYSEY